MWNATAHLAGLAADLKAHVYRPQPVLRVAIPKPDGRTMEPEAMATVNRAISAVVSRAVMVFSYLVSIGADVTEYRLPGAAAAPHSNSSSKRRVFPSRALEPESKP